MRITKKERTKRLIDSFRGLPGEFYMLKGIVCADHSVRYNSTTPEEFAAEARERKRIRVFDLVMIAERMDEVKRNGV